ncbi:MAG: DUF2007 domain-containing protein [SAR202 cluster bacterium]|nr:DUF2007 domain-containing protein [SAR202 cluster bacterium]
MRPFKDEWAVVTTEQLEPIAQMLRQMLIDAGIPAKLGVDNVRGYLGASTPPIPVLVPVAFLDEAKALLADIARGPDAP